MNYPQDRKPRTHGSGLFAVLGKVKSGAQESPGGCGKHPRGAADLMKAGRHVKPILPTPGSNPQSTFCAIQSCHEKVSARYDVPICHEHMLYCWWVVEQDRAASEMTVEQVVEEDKQRSAERLREAKRNLALPEVLPYMDGSRGFIYYIKIGEYLKIGYTSDLQSRMRSYPPNAEILAVTRGTSEDENRLHGKFAAYCDSGKEWYLDVPEIREHVERSKTRADAVPQSMWPKKRKGNAKATSTPRRRGGASGRVI